MTWSKQTSHPNFKNCTQIAYEDVFPLPTSSANFTLQTQPTSKEPTMNIQALLFQLFGNEKPTTDYDKCPAYLVVAYNRDGSELGTTTAPSIAYVKDKVANEPLLWGCKVLTYKLDKEVFVAVPVKVTAATVAESADEQATDETDVE